MGMSLASVSRHMTSFMYVLVLFNLASGATRKLRRICKDSEIEILSNQGARIEPYQRSRVELFLVDPAITVFSTNHFQLEFDFKTRAPNGVLFYGRSEANPNELIAVVLQGGDIIYKIQCPTLHADILIPTRDMRRLNDNYWHTISYSVKFGRHGHKGEIYIDGFSDTKRYEVSCEQMTSIVMGGHSPNDHRYRYFPELARPDDHFDGCIRNVHIPTALRSPPKYYAVSVCDD